MNRLPFKPFSPERYRNPYPQLRTAILAAVVLIMVGLVIWLEINP